MIDVVAKLHDYADYFDDVGRSDLSEILDKVASDVVLSYKFRIRKRRKSRGVTRVRRNKYYRRNKVKMRMNMKRYRKKNRNFLRRRRKLKHHRFG